MYYNVGSYLTELLNPLIQNEFIIRDSFDAANKIKSYLVLLKWNHYLRMCRFRKISIILDRVFNNRLIATQLKKRTLKKLIKNLH